MAASADRPWSMARHARSRPSARGGGAHRAATGRAAGTVSPAPTVRISTSTRSGRSSVIARSVGRPSARIRRRRHRAATAAAATSATATTGSTRRAKSRPAAAHATRRSGTGSGRRPASRRRREPSASARCGPDGSAEVRRRGRCRARLGIADATTTALTAASTRAIIGRLAPAGTSTTPRGRRVPGRTRCRSIRAASPTGSARTQGRGWRGGTRTPRGPR